MQLCDVDCKKYIVLLCCVSCCISFCSMLDCPLVECMLVLWSCVWMILICWCTWTLWEGDTLIYVSYCFVDVVLNVLLEQNVIQGIVNGKTFVYYVGMLLFCWMFLWQCCQENFCYIFHTFFPKGSTCMHSNFTSIFTTFCSNSPVGWKNIPSYFNFTVIV